MGVIKLGIFFVFLRVFLFFRHGLPVTVNMLLFGLVIVVSIFFSLLAIRETNIKRILALTSINQISYGFFGLLAPTVDTISATYSFFIVYIFTLILFLLTVSLGLQRVNLREVLIFI